jgi:hypothetical protein
MIFSRIRHSSNKVLSAFPLGFTVSSTSRGARGVTANEMETGEEIL